MPMQNQSASGNDAAWVNRLFDCCTPGRLCFITACCPCITYGKTQHWIRNGSLEGYSCCNSSCVVFAIAAHMGLQCFPAMMQRNVIRKMFGLEGSWLGDFCRSCLCTCCVLMQNEKEAKDCLSSRGVSEPYRPNENMVYGQAR